MTDGMEGARPVSTQLPLAQMQEMLRALRTMAAGAPGAHALHWLIFQEYLHNPIMCHFTWLEAWTLHAQIALLGLLEQAVEGRTTPEILWGISTAINNMFGGAQAEDRCWDQFLQTTPSARKNPLVQAFDEMQQAEGKQLQALKRPAHVIQMAVAQALSMAAPG